jgi:hypothetical protein
MRKLRTQLLGLFGVSVIVAVVVYVSVLYGCTAVVAEILVIGSRYEVWSVHFGWHFCSTCAHTDATCMQRCHA